MAQNKTVTNADLEKYWQARLAADREYRENYERLGMPSPTELDRRREQSRIETERLSEKLRSAELERERLDVLRDSYAQQATSYERVIDLAARAALALGLEIQETSVFSRKNYFYPDLPKGYQISQYDKPFSANGHLTILTADRDEHGRVEEWKPMTIHIQRMHLEEDAGRTFTKGLPETDKYSYRPESGRDSAW
ncbi:MAG: hypothetical protein IPP63_19145 [Chloracidobacterium sp.]|nr:hypothetical protein [Chloracidobacterium sp.]